MNTQEIKLNQYVEISLVVSYLRVAFNKIASMDINDFPDDLCQKINECANMIEDTSMALLQEKLIVLYKLRMEQQKGAFCSAECVCEYLDIPFYNDDELDKDYFRNT